MKRNAERYKFREPRLRVDPVWARSRRSWFSFCKVLSDLNFAVTFAKNALSGPKSRFWAYFPILGPKSILGSKTHFWLKNRLWAEKASVLLDSHWFLEASATWGRNISFSLKNHFLHRNSLFASEIVLWSQNRLLSKISTFWVPRAPSRQNG